MNLWIYGFREAGEKKILPPCHTIQKFLPLIGEDKKIKRQKAIRQNNNMAKDMTL
jgi:hypothetical protein